MDKNWRVDKDEFYDLLERWLDGVNARIIADKDSYYEDSKIYHRRFLDEIDCMKAAVRNDFPVDERIQKKITVASHDVETWAYSSMNPRSKKDIVVRCIANMIYKCNIICESYVFNTEFIDSEEFIDDILFITSGIFSFSKWDDKHVQAVKRFYFNYVTEPYKTNKVRFTDDPKIVSLFAHHNSKSEMRAINISPEYRIDFVALCNNPTINIYDTEYGDYIENNNIITSSRDAYLVNRPYHPYYNAE